MNTDELKKLAEAMQLTSPQLASMGFDSFAEADKLRSRFRSEAPAAILKLLAINAELVEALKKAIPHINPKAIDGDMVQNHPMEDCYINTIAMAALAKAEGGEL